MLSRNEIGIWAEISEGNSDWKPISEWRERKPAFQDAPKAQRPKPTPVDDSKIKVAHESPISQSAPDLPPLPHESVDQSPDPNAFSDDSVYSNENYANNRTQEGGFFYWALMPLRKYAEFSGRACRKEYWLFSLIVLLISFPGLYAVGYGIGYVGFSSGYSEQEVMEVAEVAGGIISLLFLLPIIAVTIRRLHDTNRSGWWWLLAFTGIGSLILLLFAVQEGTDGDNEYGPNPKYED